MRTSLNEISLIDERIFNTAPPENKLLLDAMLIINPALNEQVAWQKQTHAIVKQYSRKKLKAEIEAVHHQLFNKPEHLSFRQRIMALFR